MCNSMLMKKTRRRVKLEIELILGYFSSLVCDICSNIIYFKRIRTIITVIYQIPCPQSKSCSGVSFCLMLFIDLFRVYLSSSPESYGSSMIVSAQSELDSESCLPIEKSPQTSVPQHAIQAFRLLKESAEAQVSN